MSMKQAGRDLSCFALIVKPRRKAMATFSRSSVRLFVRLSCETRAAGAYRVGNTDCFLVVVVAE